MKLVVTIMLLLVTAAGLAVGATYLLAGLPWAMVAGSIALLAFAGLLARGVTPNG